MDRRIELTEGFGFGPIISVFSLQGKVHVVIQLAEVVFTVFSGNVRPDSQVVCIFQFHRDARKRVASHIGHKAGYGAQLKLRAARREDQQPDRHSENEPLEHNTQPIAASADSGCLLRSDAQHSIVQTRGYPIYINSIR